MPRYLTPLTVKNYSPRYNVLYGKESVEEQVGAIKIAGRAIKNFGLNKHNARITNTLGEISHFLSKHENVTDNDVAVYNINKFPNPFNLTTKNKTLHFPKTNDYYELHQAFGGNEYYLWIPAQKDNTNNMMRIKASNDQELAKKIIQILNSDTAQAKLECNVRHRGLGKLPYRPAKEIFYNEHKSTGDYEAHGFTKVGNEYQTEAFDTKIGSVDGQQLGYYLPNENFQNYSKRTNEKFKVRDDAWLKAHTTSMFVDASTEIKEILGHVILQTYAGKKPEPEYVSQMTNKLKQDYLYDTYGQKNRGGKIRQSSIPFTKIPLGKFGTRWQFSNDVHRGNRFWQDLPMSHQELINRLYKPQADGSAVFLYDENPEKFMKLADELAIKPIDRQYTAHYGRKAIAARVVLQLIQDELVKIDFKNPELSPEQRAKAKSKHIDLIRFQDKLFMSLGDLKSVFRKSNVGFAAYTRAVATEDIPDIVADKAYNRQNTGIPSSDGFVKSASHLHEYVDKMAYIEEFWGWQFRVSLGRVLFGMFKDKIFDREIPDVVVENAVAMFAETVDRSSKRLKSFNEFYLKDADLASNTRTFVDLIKRYDFPGASEVLNQQKENISEFFQGRQSVGRTNVKRMIMQNEGVSYEREIWPTLNLKYRGHRKGSFTTNYLTHAFVLPYAEKNIGNLLPLFVDIARIMKSHQTTLRHHNLTKPTHDYQKNDFVYQTPEMMALTEYIHKAADNLSDKYFDVHKNVFRTSPEKDVKILRKQVHKEYMNILNMAVNIVAILSHTDYTAALAGAKEK